MDTDTAQGLAIGGMGLVWALGAGLTVTVGFAATVPVHEPIRATAIRVWTWARRSLRLALTALYVITGTRLVYSLAVSYLHWGWRRQKHAYVTRGRHRPAYIAANPWRPVLTWSTGMRNPSIEWTYM